jgi:hypothetical protein
VQCYNGYFLTIAFTIFHPPGHFIFTALQKTARYRRGGASTLLVDYIPWLALGREQSNSPGSPICSYFFVNRVSRPPD